MYLLGIYFENVQRNHGDRFLFPVERDRIRKWTTLSAGASGRELLQLMALACGGAPFIKWLPFDFGALSATPGLPVRIEFILAPHTNRESRKPLPARFGSGIRIDAEAARISVLKKEECRLIPNGLPVQKPAYDTGRGYFDESADRLINELIAIVFPQNMKSMEKYYRWLSKRYVQAFGRLHQNSVAQRASVR